MPPKTAPRAEWLQVMQRRAISAAHWDHCMTVALDRIEPLRRQLRGRGRSEGPAPLPQPINRQEICNVIAMSTILADLRDEERDARRQWHQDQEWLAKIVPHLLSLLCPDCVAKIGDSGLVDEAIDCEEADAVMEVVDFINRFNGAQRRRVLRILSAINESGTETVFQVTSDGEGTVEQGGLTASNMKARAV